VIDSAEAAGMITRLWRGWTKPDDADAYERLLREEILPGIAGRVTEGYRGARLFRRDVADGVEFLTILTFESEDAIRTFVGDDIEAANLPERARALLARFETRAQHYREVALDPS
jgi:heme-degrading monooxygenase HmoA